MLSKLLNISEFQFPHPENGWPCLMHRGIIWDGVSQKKELTQQETDKLGGLGMLKKNLGNFTNLLLEPGQWHKVTAYPFK